MGRAGGGVLKLPAEATTTVRNGVILPEGVTLDLNGGGLVAILDDANAAGVRMLSRTALLNGSVTVVSRGSPGIQAGAHAPVLIGALLGENPDPGRLSRFEAPAGWRVSGVTLRSDKHVRVGDLRLGAPGIQVMGGARGGIIEDVRVPDSDRMAGGVFLDWGTVGAIRSDDVAGSAKAFAAGEAWTTHPRDIVIRRVKVGRLTRSSAEESGSAAVRLSGVSDIAVSDISAQAVTQAGFRFTAGDLGFEFARSETVARAHRGVRLMGMRVAEAGSYLVRTDSYADNVGRAAAGGYRPRLPVVAPTDLEVRDVAGGWSGSDQPGWGLRVDHQDGGRYTGFDVTGFLMGFVVDEQVSDVELAELHAHRSRRAAMLIGHPQRPPRGVRVFRASASGTGAALQLLLERSDGVTLGAVDGLVLRRSPSARGVVVAE